MKFGGTSVADVHSIGKVTGIIEHYRNAGSEIAVVISAQRGVTDQLIGMSNEIVESTDTTPIEPFIDSLRARHLKVLNEVAPQYSEEATRIIEDRLKNLRGILHALFHLRELTPRSKDYIISFGERLNAPVVAAAMMQKKIPVTVLDGCEAGIVTTENHGDAIALPESDFHIRSRVVPLLANSVPVIMGFMGCTRKGQITTLGRSGSDYSAAVIGSGIDADEIWIWTDVDGIMTTDPRLVPEARVLPVVSYLEVMELSFFGAKVMHPRSIEPAMRRGIPVRVKNTFNPSHPGTCIIESGQCDTRVVKALTYIDKVGGININGAQMVGRTGVAKAIFSLLADHDINLMMISQASSEANISLIIEEEQLSIASDALGVLVKRGFVREVTQNRDVCAVAVVGAGMAGAAGTGGRIFTAMGRSGINIIMISQGSSEANVSFVVRKEDGPKAIQALHDEFQLSSEPEEERC